MNKLGIGGIRQVSTQLIYLATFWGAVGGIIKMKKYYSIDKIIQKSDYQLDHHDLKDLCIRGQLTPCIYFTGNIVCIHEERHQNEIDARELGPHIRSISWTSTFKGYINSDEFLDFIDPSTTPTTQTNVFFKVQKIIEYIDPLNEFQSLAQDEYLKAFPRMTDDDIRNIRWLVEDKHFEGNPFSSTEIVFHHSEVDALFSQSKNITDVKPETPILFKNEFFSLIDAACIIANENPVLINNAWDDDNFSIKFPKFVEAHNFVRSIYLTSNLKDVEAPLFLAHELKQLFANKDIFIEGFNENVEKIELETELYELRKEKISLLKENVALESKLQELENTKVYLETTMKENCLPFTGDDPNFPIELSLANFIWSEIYINKIFPQKYSHEQATAELFKTMNFSNIPLTEKLKDRLKSVTTPLRLKTKEWNVFKENQKNHGHALSKNTEGTP